MNILWYIHWLVPISVILMPFLPKRYLYYIFWYPLVYFIIWLIFDGCPLNGMTPVDEQNTSKDRFLLPLFQKYISPDITAKQSDRFVHSVMVLAIVVSAYRLLWNCKKCKK